MKVLSTLFVSFGIMGWISALVLWILIVVGYVFNIVGLCKHLPLLDIETVLRIAGLFYGPLGAILGWFL